ncbi:hypothetical protein KGQ19_15940 [Catenulispora sp. NL8]|uniref:Uncharacterized protein n=1 Tax=Catenulispora pinistramenti TaxID=2705254 RepID=A0ABS5KQN7_9ACTN|nr:hypothetical protein [Catenulispora pinistramenti]MBS2548357.1 hypothetical protein [Catenulispora pinistramenti]
MSMLTAENQAAEYMVECEPISTDEYRIMADAASRFGDRYGSGYVTRRAVLAEIGGLQQLVRAPEVFMGDHTTHQFRNEHGPQTAHWMMSGVYTVNDESVRFEVDSHRQAAAMTAVAWAAARTAGGPGPEAKVSIFRGALDPSWLAELPTPTPEDRPVEQLTALVQGADFARFDTTEQVRAAYTEQHRTHVFEGMNATYGWAYLASRWLGALSRSDLTVLVDLFDSRHGDGRLDTHYDCWYNVTVQLSGAKDWRVGRGLIVPGEEIVTHTMRAGDVMVIPHDVPHHVDTPADPGHSRHLIFTIDRRESEQLTTP